MYTFKTNVNASEHDVFVEKHDLCNLLQSSSWAKVKENWDSLLVGVYEKNTLVASALVLIKQLPLDFTMFYTPRGPIMDYENTDLVVFFIKELKAYAKTKHALFIKMDPGIHINDYPIQELNNQRYPIKKIMENMKLAGALHQGYSKTIQEVIQPRYQANVYKDDAFEQRLPRHTKRLIKDAQKHNVQVVHAGEDRVHEFSEVVALSEKRKQVSLRNEEYFSLLMDIYKEDAHLFLGEINIQESLKQLDEQREENEKALLTVDVSSRKKLTKLHDQKRSLEKQRKELEQFSHIEGNVVIAGVLSIRFGNTMEMLYAGMNDQFKKFMPQYHIYVENMKYAFQEGCEFCNMGGVEGDLTDGLTTFKSNFNPMINEFIGEFDIPVNKFLYRMSKMAYQIRKRK
ncbi:MAG: peptidoglycan bridge formation glycyltransferase FemA/FemB family protein [Breznakia sp.]